MVALLVASTGCQADAEQAQVPLRANAVGGGLVEFDNLADADTVLWFWAPW